MTFSVHYLFGIHKCQHHAIAGTLFATSIMLNFAVAGPEEYTENNIKKKEKKKMNKDYHEITEILNMNQKTGHISILLSSSFVRLYKLFNHSSHHHQYTTQHRLQCKMIRTDKSIWIMCGREHEILHEKRTLSSNDKWKYIVNKVNSEFFFIFFFCRKPNEKNCLK